MIVRELLIAVGMKLDERSVKKVKDGIDDTKESARQFQLQNNSTAASLVGVATGMLSVAAAAQGLKFLVGVIANFQQLRAQLVTIEQDEKKAEAAFARLRTFAKTTPFELKNVVDAFSKLRAVGIDPTDDDLRNFGDIAAGMGKDIVEFSEAVVGATTGEMERLKAFGIVASQQGKKVTFTFKGKKKTIRKDSKAIVKYLSELGKANFAGGMARQAQTVKGAFSNLLDNVSAFAVEVGEAGLGAALIELIRLLTGTAKNGTNLAKVLGEVLTKGVKTFTRLVKWAVENSEALRNVLAVLITVKTLSMMGNFLTMLGALNAGLIIPTIASAALAAALLLIFLVLSDIVGFVQGKESVIQEFFSALGFNREEMELLAFTLGLLTAAFGALLVSIFGIPAAIGLALVALALLVYFWDDITKAAGDFADALPGMIDDAYAVVIDTLAGWMVKIADMFMDLLRFVGTVIGEGFAIMWLPFGNAFDTVMAHIRDMWSRFVAWFFSSVDRVRKAVMSIPNAARDALRNIPGIGSAVDVARRAVAGDGGAQAGAQRLLGAGAMSPALDMQRRANQVANNRSTSVTTGAVQITVNPPPGADPEQIAASVGQRFGTQLRAQLDSAAADLEGAPE